MKPYAIAACVLVAVFVAFKLSRQHGPAPDTIEYQGQSFRLSKTYSDYDDFKNDLDNIDASENARVEQAVIQAPIRSSFTSREEVIHAAFALRFPGYGLASFGERKQADGSVLMGCSIEIPRANKSRIFVFRGEAEQYSLIDDFIAADEPCIMAVRETDGRLLYSTIDGKEVVSRPLKK